MSEQATPMTDEDVKALRESHEKWKRLAMMLFPRQPQTDPKDGPCCYSLTKMNSGKERYVGEGCSCGNYDDAQSAASWADSMNIWLDAVDTAKQEGLLGDVTRALRERIENGQP